MKSASPGTSIDAEQSVRESLLTLAHLAQGVALGELGSIARYAEMARDVLAGGGRLFFCGNGGSAADAQHLAAEYVVKMERDRQPLAALALTTDTSVLTAAGNDRGFQEIFARQLQAIGQAGDLLVLHSTSGNSENLLRAAAAASKQQIATVALLAKGGGRLKEIVDVAIVVPTDITSRAQEIHLAIGHAVCQFVEANLPDVLGVLAPLRRAEKSQTLFYRALATAATLAGDEIGSQEGLVERLNELHADEQHHLSRLTARILELGVTPESLDDVPRPDVALEGWEEVARQREQAEIEAYEAALEDVDDEATQMVLEEILESERKHEANLGGKWMSA
ncbi:MAG: SIS domain-containing protein [Longimicrobiales bacterium]